MPPTPPPDQPNQPTVVNTLPTDPVEAAKIEPLAPTSGVIAAPAKRKRNWSDTIKRSRTVGIAAAIIVIVATIVLVVVYFVKTSTTKKKASTTGNITSSLPDSQLQKLTTDAINVTPGSSLSFNYPVTVKRTLNATGQTTLGDVVINGTLKLASQGSSNQTITQGLTVTGTSLLQGDITGKGNLTLGGNLNTSGNGGFGGNVSANQLTVKSANLGSLTIGHVITSGATPTVTPGGPLGTGGSVHISGNDTGGTVTMNVGSSPRPGDIVTVAFRSAYTSTPHVVVSPVGQESA